MRRAVLQVKTWGLPIEIKEVYRASTSLYLALWRGFRPSARFLWNRSGDWLILSLSRRVGYARTVNTTFHRRRMTAPRVTPHNRVRSGHALLGEITPDCSVVGFQRQSSSHRRRGVNIRSSISSNPHPADRHLLETTRPTGKGGPRKDVAQ